MIITRTPFRVSLFGGGTDLPTFYREHSGAVLGFSLSRYCYITLRLLPPFFPTYKHRIVYSRTELVDRIDQIEHPSVAAILADQCVEEGLEVHHFGDLPARSGLGSSSSFTVGLLHALYAHRGVMVSPSALAREATRIEQEVEHQAVGDQDQLWAAHGGLNRIDFLPDDGPVVTPLTVSRERRAELCANLLLVFSGVSRFAVEVEKEKIAVMPRNIYQLTALRDLVDEGQRVLCSGEPVEVLGKLLDASWRLKRGLASGVSTGYLDELYAAATGAGASGGKVLGAGGGGFVLFVVAPERRAAVVEALKGLVVVPVGIDDAGSRVVVYEP